jgi:hypothetical protein
MVVQLKKFGITLVSRPAGKEALLAFRSTFSELKNEEKLVIDFEDVVVLTPSWIDEFLTPLVKEADTKIELINTSNPSVKASLEIITQQHGIDFNDLIIDET